MPAAPIRCAATPKSSLGPGGHATAIPYGGNLLTVARTELILPLPAKWQTSARAACSSTMGNVFSTDGTKYLGRDLQTPVNYKFKL